MSLVELNSMQRDLRRKICRKITRTPSSSSFSVIVRRVVGSGRGSYSCTKTMLGIAMRLRETSQKHARPIAKAPSGERPAVKVPHDFNFFPSLKKATYVKSYFRIGGFWVGNFDSFLVAIGAPHIKFKILPALGFVCFPQITAELQATQHSQLVANFFH